MQQMQAWYCTSYFEGARRFFLGKGHLYEEFVNFYWDFWKGTKAKTRGNGLQLPPLNIRPANVIKQLFLKTLKKHVTVYSCFLFKKQYLFHRLSLWYFLKIRQLKWTNFHTPMLYLPFNFVEYVIANYQKYLHAHMHTQWVKSTKAGWHVILLYHCTKYYKWVREQNDTK